MFGLGVQELLLILIVVVLLFGAKKIPELARGLGRGMTEFKRGMKDTDSEETSESGDKTPSSSEDSPGPKAQ